MSDQTIFGGAPQAPQQAQDPAQQQQQQQDPTATLLAGIVDENGRQKYADVATALQALSHSQDYIQQLHGTIDTKDAQLASYQTELSQRDTVQDFVEKLRPGQQQEPSVTEPPAPTGLDADAASKLFDQLLTQREADSQRKSNTDAVIKSLTEKYGDKADEMFRAKAAELDMSIDELNSLSGTSPKAVLAQFGAVSTETGVDVSQSTAATPDQGEQPQPWGNTGKSVLSGSTSREVRAEAQLVRDLVAEVHEKGGSIEEMTDPKVYFQTFGKRD